jgi:hypothetical protein
MILNAFKDPIELSDIRFLFSPICSGVEKRITEKTFQQLLKESSSDPDGDASFLFDSVNPSGKKFLSFEDLPESIALPQPRTVVDLLNDLFVSPNFTSKQIFVSSLDLRMGLILNLGTSEECKE